MKLELHSRANWRWLLLTPGLVSLDPQPAARYTHEHGGRVCHPASQHANLPPQILFETFNFPALYLANQGVLSLYASGRTSGTIIESGDGMTYFVPIANGYPLHLSTAKVDTAGQDLTMYLMKLLSDNGNMLETTVDLEHVRDLKEKCCYVALDYDMEMSKTSEPSFLKKFTLPDGKEISVGQETFMCPEVLFNPSLVGKNYPGIDMQAQQSITSCDKSHWKNLFGYIILSGGTSTCSGLRFRLQREIAKLVSPELSVKEPLIIWEFHIVHFSHTHFLVLSCPTSLYLCDFPTPKKRRKKEKRGVPIHSLEHGQHPSGCPINDNGVLLYLHPLPEAGICEELHFSIPVMIKSSP
ncbi:actin-like isoform X1 [Rattus rattus]|uniref:actin-like isoform X1 n=1 Tax=Rattus rattus TaxID=10117 RepID=UPI0013F32AB0|nr:actin-like isoform X1 [Rattus rattus]